MREDLPSTKILGTSITTASKDEILEYIFKRLENSSNKFYIVTPNPEILLHASRSRSYQRVLNGATLSLPDGIGVLAAGKISKKGIKRRITGIDFMDELCRESALRGLTVGFLGGRDSVAERTAKCLREKYPNLIVNFTGEEWQSGSAGPATSHPHPTASLPGSQFGRSTEAPRSASPAKSSHPSPVSSLQPTTHNLKPYSHIDILFVAMGAPKQEEWIAKNLPNIDVSVAMGVGGAFDYVSGKVPRAPRIVRKIGMEWAYRLARQPWRIKRQLVLPVFVAKVFQEKLVSKSS